jgi:Fe-S-cluster-containing dehydrogenase component
MVIDQNRCLGCEACSVACRNENNTGEIFWINVETRGGAIKDTPGGAFPKLAMDFIPRLCNHCAEPPCRDACPTNAITQSEDGIVTINREECTGCGSCEEACPYHAISIGKDGLAGKCHFCAHRLAVGEEPFCVICCEGQAMHFGDLEDPTSEVYRLSRLERAFTLLPELGTGSAVYYLSPMERRRL